MGARAVLWSSLLGPSWGVCTEGVSAALSFSGCVASVLVALAEVLVDLRPATDGEAAPQARAAASAACCRSFLRRLSSAPRLELRGRRAEGGERLVARLLWVLPVPAKVAVRLLLREREVDLRDEYDRGERLRERPERLDMGLVLEDLREG